MGDESVSLADGSLESTGETSTEIECLNSVVANDEPKDVVRMQESVTTGSEESDSGQVILAQKEESQQEVDNECVLEEKRTVEDECGNLVIVDKNGLPQTVGENETSTDVAEKEDTNEHQPQDNITDIYRVTNANEKIDRLANHQQHNSNMIHDLIIGRSKQRRVRQPRVTAPVSLVPSVPPSSSPPKEEVVDHPEGEAPQTPVRDKSLSRGFREGSLSRSIREGSVGRSIREGSPKITLPPTPITNPEKFGIKVVEKERRKVGSLSSLVSPTDSTESQDATDNMDGIISAPVSPAKSGRESNLSNSSNGKGKGKGFLSTVAGIFKTSSTSPSPNASPIHQAKASKEDSFLGRFSRKDGAKKRDEDVRELVTRTASLAMQASHPSTPPVPLSRRIKLGSQPPQASEDSFSDDDDDLTGQEMQRRGGGGNGGGGED